MTTENSGSPSAPAAGTGDAAGAAAALAASQAAAAAKPGTEADLSIGGDAEGTPAALAAEPTNPIIEFNPTGDAGLDMALGFFGKLGLGPGNKAFDAAANGDFGMLRAHLGSLGDKAKGYDGYVKLAEQAYAKGAEENKAKVSKSVEAIHAAVGGAENWKAIQTWAAANAEPAEKAEVNAALRAGGIQAKAMALWLAEKHAKAAGTTVEPKADVVAAGAAGRAANAEGGHLTAKQYAAEVAAARQKLGYNFEGSREYAALQARRIAGQRAGI